MKKVLVIDDHRAVRVLVASGLETIGFEVIAASSAMEGLHLVETQRPDVALVYINLPEVNGFELFRKIRAVDSKIPMIFVTAECSSETTIRAIRLGAFDYLPKPINLEKLRKLTVSAAGSRRLMDQPIVMPAAVHLANVGQR